MTVSAHDSHTKDLTCGGKRPPHGIVLRRKLSHTGQENLQTLAPPVHSDPYTAIENAL